MSENKFKFEHKSIVCCEEGHKIQLLIAGIAALDQHTRVLLPLLLILAMRIQFSATALGC